MKTLNTPKSTPRTTPAQPLADRAAIFLDRYVPAYRESRITARVSMAEHLRQSER